MAAQYALMPAAGWRPLSELIETSAPPVAQVAARVLGDDECAREADVDHVAELVDGHVGDQADVGESRAVDHHIDRAGLLEQPLHRILVGDVDGRGGVGVAQFGGAAARPVGVAVGDGHPVALGGQRLRRRPADSGRTADHDGDPLVTVAHPVGPSTTELERVPT